MLRLANWASAESEGSCLQVEGVTKTWRDCGGSSGVEKYDTKLNKDTLNVYFSILQSFSRQRSLFRYRQHVGLKDLSVWIKAFWAVHTSQLFLPPFSRYWEYSHSRTWKPLTGSADLRELILKTIHTLSLRHLASNAMSVLIRLPLVQQMSDESTAPFIFFFTTPPTASAA